MPQPSATEAVCAGERSGRAALRDEHMFALEKLYFIEGKARRLIIEASTDVALQTPLGIKRIAAQRAQFAQSSRAVERAKSVVDEIRKRVQSSRAAAEMPAAKAKPQRRPSQYEVLMKAARRYQQLTEELGVLEREEKIARERIFSSQFDLRKEILKQKIRSL